MLSSKRGLGALALAILGILAVPGAMTRAEPVAPSAAPNNTGSHDFDFEFGKWRVHHRALRQVSPDKRAWIEFEGTADVRPIMAGTGNVEDNVIVYPSGTYRAAALRSFDAQTGQWSIWWLDGRWPLGPLDPPVRGHFDNGVGTFYSDDIVNGKPVRTRYIWSKITPTSAQWEQASSVDNGATWETNWVMQFQRMD